MRTLRLLTTFGRWATIGLAAGAVTVLGTIPPAATAANGGSDRSAPADQPCIAPCQFYADNTGGGLQPYPTPGYQNLNATWWSFTPLITATYTFRASSIDPAGWNNTLVLTDDVGTLVGHGDDDYATDAMFSTPLVLGTRYVLALAGFDAGSQGTAWISISSSAPDAPTEVSATAGESSATVSWTAPADNNAAITEYRIHTDGSSSYISVLGSPPATTANISSLTNGVGYSFQVRAVNSNGDGAWSDSSNLVSPFGPTTTTISFSPSSPIWPNTFSVTATVSSSVLVNSGSVTFYRDSVLIRSVTVSNGTAMLQNESLPAARYTYRADYLGTATFTASGTSASVTVGKASQTITFAAPTDHPYSVGSFDVNPTSTSGLMVAVASVSPSVCTVAGHTVTLVKGGTCALNATQTGNGNYGAASAVLRTFQVVDAPQTITFATPADRLWSASTFTVAPTSSSGLTVSLASTTNDICTVASFTVAMVAAGTCTLAASQAGNSNFAPATVPRSFNIGHAAQAGLTASVTATELSPGGTANLSTAGGSGTGAVAYQITTGPDSCLVSGATLTAVAAGTCVVTATKAADERYAAATAITTGITVNAATPVLNVTGPISAHPGDAIDVTVTITGLIVGFAPGLGWTSLSGATQGATVLPAVAAFDIAPGGTSGTATFTITIGATGTLHVGAEVAGNGAYVGTSDPTALDIDITRIAQTIAFADLADRAWTATTFDLTPTASSGLTVSVASDTMEVCTVDAFSVSMLKAGTCSLKASQDGNATYELAPEATVSFDITRAEQAPFAIQLTADQATIGDTITLSTTGGSGSGAVTYAVTTGPDSCLLSGAALTAVVAGTCVVTATKAADDRYAAAASTTGTVTVTEPVVDVPHATIALSGGPSVTAFHTVVVTVTVRALRAGSPPGAVTPSLSGTSVGSSISPTSAALTLSGNGAEGTAAFTLTAADVGVEHIGATMTATGTYESATADPITIDVTERTAVLRSVTPTRLVDTRPGYWHLRPAPDAKLAGGQVLAIKVTDIAGLTPASNVDAVSLNLTVVEPESSGYLSAYPCGARPLVSNLNFERDSIVANAAVVPVDPATGTVCVFSNVTTHVVVDLSGWLATADGFHPTAPARVFDTRPGTTSIRDRNPAKVPSGSTLAVQFTDLPGRVPAGDVAAVVINLTVVAPERSGFVTAFACGTRPGTSSINFVAGQTVANSVIAPVDAATGRVCFYASATTYLLADIGGWFEVNHAFVPTAPTRWFDTRVATKVARESVLRVNVADLAALGVTSPVSSPGSSPGSSPVSALSLNVTITEPDGRGFVTVFACGTRPLASNLNYSARQTVANAVIAPVDRSTGSVCFYSSASTHFVVDINGWFLTPYDARP